MYPQTRPSTKSHHQNDETFMALIAQQEYNRLWELLEKKFDVGKNNDGAFSAINNWLLKHHPAEVISENTVKNAFYLNKYLKVSHRTVRSLCLAAEATELADAILFEPSGGADIHSETEDKKAFFRAIANAIWEGFYFDENGLKISRLEVVNDIIRLELPDNLVYEGNMDSACIEGNFIDLRLKSLNDPRLCLLTRFDRIGTLDNQTIFIGMYLNSKRYKIVAGTFALVKKSPEAAVRPGILKWGELFSALTEFETPSYLYGKTRNKITARSDLHSKLQLESWIKGKRPKSTDFERLATYVGHYFIVYLGSSGQIGSSRRLVLSQITTWDFCAEMKNVKVRDKRRDYSSCDLSLINYALFITFAYENDRIQLAMILKTEKETIDGIGEVKYLKGTMTGSYYNANEIGKPDILLIGHAGNYSTEQLQAIGRAVFMPS